MRGESSYSLQEAVQSDADVLAGLRERAMRPSLEAVGRYDPLRVRTRFLDGFNPKATFKILIEGRLAGFYVLLTKSDHLYLDHLYIDPEFQSFQLGGQLIEKIKHQAKEVNLPLRLQALKQSRANGFYVKHGFVKTHETEFDLHYELK
ncbi:MAG: GNAT family N-acetyltransferase [Pseudomonadota bacterium]|nr:GNAT family N-acetyltransferase [Pseudomonadota bacterium]